MHNRRVKEFDFAMPFDEIKFWVELRDGTVDVRADFLDHGDVMVRMEEATLHHNDTYSLKFNRQLWLPTKVS